MSWNEENEERFRLLWTSGKSASQIAGILKTTRSAICAKARRMNLPGRRPSGNPSPRPGPGRPRAEPRKERPAKLVDRRDAQERRMPRPPPPPPRPAPLVEPAPARKADGDLYTLMDISDKACRWPRGTPGEEGFHFCGNGPQFDSPYCEYHARLSYQPLQDRGRRPS